MGIATSVMALGNDYDAARAVGLMARIVKIDGVNFVDFNYLTNKVTVRFDPDRVSLKELKDIVLREREHQERPDRRRRSSARASGGPP
jgi:allophanate hydrolase subunit 1